MSAISRVSSTPNPYQTTNQNGFAQFIQDFNAVGSALQSGDVSGAQSALATFSQDLPANSTTSSTHPFGKNSQADTDYQNLTTALQSGNLSAAQQAFASLQKDLQRAGTSGKAHHHHHHGSDDSQTTPSATTTASTSSSSSAAAAALLDATA